MSRSRNRQEEERYEVRDRRGGDRFFIDNIFYRGGWAARIGVYGQAVYNVLALHADADTQESWPSLSTIAKLAGMSRRQVIRVMEDLIALRLVQKTQEWNTETGHTKNIYVLPAKKEWLPVETSPEESARDDESELVTGSHQGGVCEAPSPDELVTGSHQGGVCEAPGLVSVRHWVGVCEAPEQDTCNKTQGTRLREQEEGGPPVTVPSVAVPSVPSVPPLQLAGLWKTCLDELRLQMTTSTFTTWLAGSRLVELEDATAVISVRDSYAVEWLSTRLYAPVQRTMQGIAGVDRICFVVQEEEPPARPARLVTPARRVDGESRSVDGGSRSNDWETMGVVEQELAI